MTYNLRTHASKQVQGKMRYNLRRSEPRQLQGSTSDINDELEEQPTTAELLESTHHLENNDFVTKIVKKPRTERVAVARKYPSSVKIVIKPPRLSKLKPPSRSDGFKTDRKALKILNTASQELIARINKAADANEMIDLASKAFDFLDIVPVDYTPVYEAAHSVISQRCDIEALVQQKPQYAFDTITAHNEAASEFSEAEERYSGVNRELEEAQRDVDGSTARLNYLYDERKKAEEEKKEIEAKVAAVRADKASCDEAYSRAKSKLEEIAPKMSEAQKEIDEFERRWKEVTERLNLAMEELSRLRI
ncbi:hypothetical protein HanXRQr2_Chr03g0130301 [Helianthus annuus]|uniref:Uncharacterized protein n=2 Tax=Helianthus annuus TaxID=4232 RepID=A0A251V9Z1_HELAN|nr:uncharacterized protein LOC110930489 isoform X1 [Helianthus annuus]XP_022029492.1 uncharacterized protein LOC110930489 isoform X1 [Helianthus annuus]XP_022029493.1 uncharacterized protein LOC110930489 isoform X1 [Helianthus annuus]KAF5816070.1 hypothetical protein HanXRQr2_Chr03g0130301 [Helianthus annuus]KAJ0609465.1 hypothetical protein HanHA89_Chr03g0120321 [Helianthus annuus]KAJ0945342.1 hypothetical protein HanPSC8_Chr03g0127121 [Helianthus annuus]